MPSYKEQADRDVERFKQKIVADTAARLEDLAPFLQRNEVNIEGFPEAEEYPANPEPVYGFVHGEPDSDEGPTTADQLRREAAIRAGDALHLAKNTFRSSKPTDQVPNVELRASAMLSLPPEEKQ